MSCTQRPISPVTDGVYSGECTTLYLVPPVDLVLLSDLNRVGVAGQNKHSRACFFVGWDLGKMVRATATSWRRASCSLEGIRFCYCIICAGILGWGCYNGPHRTFHSISAGRRNDRPRPNICIVRKPVAPVV